MGKKKVYVKVEKPIEPGDLVRCMEHDWPFNPGDIRKVDCLGADSKTFFYVKGSEGPHGQEFWQPVHKLQIGDQVLWKGEGKSMTVEQIDTSRPEPVYIHSDYDYDHAWWSRVEDLELYQFEKHDRKMRVFSEQLYRPADTTEAAGVVTKGVKQMREIKFRGRWYKPGEGWVWRYGYLARENFISSDSFYGEVRSGTVGQYTGLKDKNGKEIYEGDIIQELAGEHAQGVWEYHNIVVIEDLRWIPDSLGYADHVYVIGNIYDNPELKGVAEND